MANKPITFDPNQPFTDEAPKFDASQPFTTEPEASAPVAPVDDGHNALLAAVKSGTGQDVVESKPTQQNSYSTVGDVMKQDMAPVFNQAIEHQGGWGLSDETRGMLGGNDTNPYTKGLTTIVPSLAELGFRAYQASLAGIETGATMTDRLSDASGLADALSYDGNKFHPGNAAMSLMEAFPFAGQEVGGLKPSVAGIEQPVHVSPEIEAGYLARLKNGTVDDVMNFTKDNGFEVDPDHVKEYIKARDEGRPVGTEVSYADGSTLSQRLGDEAAKFKPAEETAHPLEKEAADFKSKQVEPTAEDLFPTEESRAAKAKAWEDKFTADAEKFKNRDKTEQPVEFNHDEPFTEEPPKAAEAPAEPIQGTRPKEEQDHLESIVNQVNDHTKDWANPPSVEVVHSVDDIADPSIRAQALQEGADKDALGFIGQDGKVRIIGKNITDPSEVPAVLFHESLGHYGLAQKFGDDLNANLRTWYDNNVGDFKGKVDTWLEENPDAYKNVPDRHAAAFEEVLAEESEKGSLSPTLTNKVTNYVKDVARKMGIDLKYSDREIKTILGMAHDAVIKGKASAADNGFKFMRKKPKVETVENSIDPNVSDKEDFVKEKIKYIDTVHDVDDLIDQLKKDHPKEVVTHAETKRQARDLDMTYSKLAKGKPVGEVAAQLHAYGQIRTNLLDEVSKYKEKIDDGNFSYQDKVNYTKKAAELAVVHARVQNDSAQFARAMNALKILKTSKMKADAIMKEMATNGGPMAMLADHDTFMKFARSVQQHLDAKNAQGASKVMTNILKPYWEDYVLTGRHAAMLSGLGTHYKNIMENLNIIGRELLETAAAIPGGHVTPTEVAARGYGLMRAGVDMFSGGQTFQDVVNTFRKGHGRHVVSSKIEIENARIPGISKVNDLLAAEDLFFRHFMDNSNLYGLGVRRAQEMGFKGKAAFEQGSHFAINPSPEMLLEANKTADRSLLVDKPSILTSAVEGLKTRKPTMTGTDRVIRFTSHVLFPFLRVSDRVIARRIARSPFSFMDRATREDWKAGGARRDVAVSRTLLGTAAIGYLVSRANKGDIVGDDVAYKKQQSLEGGGYQPNSVKENGQYTDATSLVAAMNPFAIHTTMATDVATLVNAYKKGSVGGKEYTDGMMKLVATAARVPSLILANSFASNLDPLTDAVKNPNNDMTGSGKLSSFAATTTASFVPAMVRTANNSMLDDIRRDTAGDKSLLDRVQGKAKASLPKIPYLTDGSTSLPAKYDVYGRPMKQGKNLSGVKNYQKIDQDPTVKELQRLERTQDDPLVTPAPASFKKDGASVKLTGQKYAQYQKLSGTLFLNAMKKATAVDGWSKADDNLKKEVVKEVLKDARSAAKEVLFNQSEEPNAPDDTTEE